MNRSTADTIQDTIDLLFSRGSGRNAQPSIEGLGAHSGFKPASTRFEAQVDETTRHVREITDPAAEQRQAKVAVLRATRLQKEADDRAAAALVPTKKASRSRKAASAAPS